MEEVEVLTTSTPLLKSFCAYPMLMVWGRDGVGQQDMSHRSKPAQGGR